jgi:uncharacterized membrane protein
MVAAPARLCYAGIRSLTGIRPVEKNRLEAFSDGVIAIIITIMVLEMKVPHEATFEALEGLIPVFLSYVLSFIYIGIYWNNHHHMLHTVKHVSGAILWANTHLLFWLSLVPFTTAWMGENHFTHVPTAVYGVSLLMCACAYTILQITIIRHDGKGSILKRAIGKDAKGKISPLLYVSAIVLAFIQPWIANAIYAAVALIWIIPDRRIEKQLKDG